MRKSGFDLSDSIGANRILRGEPNSEPAILAWLPSAWQSGLSSPAAASWCTAGVAFEGRWYHQANHQTARVQLAPTLFVKPNSGFYSPTQALSPSPMDCRSR